MAINIDYGAGRGMAGMYQNLLNIQQEGQRQLAEKERRKTEQMQGLFQAAGGFLGRREQARQAEAAGAFQQQGQQAIKSAEQDYLAGLEKYDASIEAAGSPEAKAAAYRDKELYTQSYQDRINAINQKTAERQKAFSESGFLGIGRDTDLLGGGFKDLPSMYAPESATAAQEAAVAGKQRELSEAQQRAQKQLFRAADAASMRTLTPFEEMQTAKKAASLREQELSGVRENAVNEVATGISALDDEVSRRKMMPPKNRLQERDALLEEAAGFNEKAKQARAAAAGVLPSDLENPDPKESERAMEEYRKYIADAKYYEGAAERYENAASDVSFGLIKQDEMDNIIEAEDAAKVYRESGAAEQVRPAIEEATKNLQAAKADVVSAEQNYDNFLKQQEEGMPVQAGFVTKAKERLKDAKKALKDRQDEVDEGFIRLPSGRMVPRAESAVAMAEKQRQLEREEARQDQIFNVGLDLAVNSTDPRAVGNYIAQNNLPPEFGGILQSTVNSNEFKEAEGREAKARVVNKSIYDNLLAQGQNEAAFNFARNNGLVPRNAKFTDQAQINQNLQLLRNMSDPEKAGKILSNMRENDMISSDVYDIHMAIVEENKGKTDTQKALALSTSPALSDEQQFAMLKKAYPRALDKVEYQEFANVRDEFAKAVDMAGATGVRVNERILNAVGITDKDDQDAFNNRVTYGYNVERFKPQVDKMLMELDGALSGAVDGEDARKSIDEIIAKYPEAAKFMGYDSRFFKSKLLTDRGKAIKAERLAAQESQLEYKKLQAEVTKAVREGSGKISPSKLADVWSKIYSSNVQALGANEAAMAANAGVTYLRQGLSPKEAAAQADRGGSQSFLRRQGFGEQPPPSGPTGGPQPESTPAPPDSARPRSAEPNGEVARSGPLGFLQTPIDFVIDALNTSYNERLEDVGMRESDLVGDILSEMRASGTSVEDATRKVLSDKYVGTKKEKKPFRTVTPDLVKNYADAIKKTERSARGPQ